MIHMIHKLHKPLSLDGESHGKIPATAPPEVDWASPAGGRPLWATARRLVGAVHHPWGMSWGMSWDWDGIGFWGFHGVYQIWTNDQQIWINYLIEIGGKFMDFMDFGGVIWMGYETTFLRAATAHPELPPREEGRFGKSRWALVRLGKSGNE